MLSKIKNKFVAKMVAILILSLALLSGAASAFKLEDVKVATDVESRNGTTNTPVLLERFPTIVQMDFLNQWGWWGWTQGCAASILNQRNVLTAASCVSGPYYGGSSTRRVRAGANYRHVGGVIAYVERVFNHHGFRNYTVGNGTASVIRYVHDISVVRLSSFLPFTNLIRQAPILAQGSTVPGNLWLNQVGWGQQSEGFPLSVALVRTLSTWNNQSQPVNSSGVISAIGTNDAIYNVDAGGPWIWSDVTVGVIPTNNAYWNGTVVATEVAWYTNWILDMAR